MKIFIKNSFIFMLFFILLIGKDYLLNIFKYHGNINNNILTLYQNPYKLNEEIYINVGNLNINSYVVSNNTLVGIIKYSYQNYSIVRLLSSKDIYLQVKVNDCYFIMQNDNNNLYLSNNDNCFINNNDVVYSSDNNYKIGNIKISNNRYIVNLLYDYNNINNLEIRNNIWDY